jgi:uncharacterized protein HemX
MTNQRGVSAIVLILLVVLLLALGGGGFFVFKQKQQQNQPPATTFEHVDLNEEVVTFLFQRAPGLYKRVLQLNNELSLIAAELERIDELEQQYPSEKRTIHSERSLWTGLQKRLNQSVKSLKKDAESYYVAYMVNSAKGLELINENVDDLLSDIDDVLSESGTETGRLKTVSKQTPMDRLKNLF